MRRTTHRWRLIRGELESTTTTPIPVELKEPTHKVVVTYQDGGVFTIKTYEHKLITQLSLIQWGHTSSVTIDKIGE